MKINKLLAVLMLASMATAFADYTKSSITNYIYEARDYADAVLSKQRSMTRKQRIDSVRGLKTVRAELLKMQNFLESQRKLAEGQKRTSSGYDTGSQITLEQGRIEAAITVTNRAIDGATRSR
ncbi:hypothetical protein ACFLYA_00605 [Candidatus Dependentiae bacterium]